MQEVVQAAERKLYVGFGGARDEDSEGALGRDPQPRAPNARLADTGFAGDQQCDRTRRDIVEEARDAGDLGVSTNEGLRGVHDYAERMLPRRTLPGKPERLKRALGCQRAGRLDGTACWPGVIDPAHATQGASPSSSRHATRIR